jgi:2-polyprenyl-3-methyl-5-hydroxy-6-metoxy-1,4-benzoquinol methylase
MSKTYFIKQDYVHRENSNYFDDTPFKDEWQKEVYEFARTVADQNKFKNVLDIGTGSGFKLLKYFQDFDTLGVDVTKTVTWLKSTYPNKKWTDQFVPVADVDLVISSDVIEHIPDPDTLLSLIEQCNPKLIVLSTPDRDLFKLGHNGPPVNRSHVREWNMPEFNQYISSRFEVLNHFISNEEQATQVILARVKY